MTPEPTTADRQLAEDLLGKIPWQLSYAELREWTEHEASEWASSFARHRAAHEALLRAEIERLKKLVEEAYLEGWQDYEDLILRECNSKWDNSEAKKALEATP